LNFKIIENRSSFNKKISFIINDIIIPQEIPKQGEFANGVAFSDISAIRVKFEKI
jgi:hypothetical protein